jgi:GAF domain-containing protein
MIAQGRPLDETLLSLVNLIEAQAPGIYCSVLLLDPDGVHLRHGAAPSLPRDFRLAIDGEAIGPQAGSCGTAAFRRESVFVEDIATDPLWMDYRELALRHGLRACWSTPIFDSQRRVLGTFAIYYRQSGLPTPQHLRLIDITTHVASIGISRRRREEATKTINEELVAINRIITAITGVASIKEILEKVLDEALSITGLEGGTICLVTPQDTLQLAAHRATSEATILDLTANEIRVGDCLCGECARDHKTLILQDREAVLKFAPREATRGEKIRFHAAFPLTLGGKCLGVLCLFTRTDKKPKERRLKLLETITLQIALAIQNAGLFEETLRNAAVLEERVKERTAELGKKMAEIERLNRLFVGRELRIKELKEKIKELESGIRT